MISLLSPSRLFKQRRANFLLAGQSNIAEWLVDDGAPGQQFKESFLKAYSACNSVELFDTSRGGAALLQEFAEANAQSFTRDTELFDRVRRNYWFNQETGDFGLTFRRAENFIRKWRKQGIVFDGIIWSQGESDAIHLEDQKIELYLSSLIMVLRQLREISGVTKIYIQELGRITPSSSRLNRRLELVRQAQRQITDADPQIEILTTTFDLPLRDNLHLTSDAYRIAAQRMAVAIATEERSPIVSQGVMTDSGEICLRVPLVDAQRIQPCSSTVGFQLFDGAEMIPVTMIVVNADGTIILTPERPVDAVTVEYANCDCVDAMDAGDFLTVKGAKLALPVRPFSLCVRNDKALTMSTHS